jgi:hypothetical protein
MFARAYNDHLTPAPSMAGVVLRESATTMTTIKG